MPSYLPHDASNVDAFDEANLSSFDSDTNQNHALIDNDFEMVHSSSIEQEMIADTVQNASIHHSISAIETESIRITQARGSYTSSMDSDYPVFSYSQDIQSAIDGILYIAQRLKDENEENKVIYDWQFIAMVLDRFFLWIFTLICLIGSAIILLRAPSLYDQTVPIDSILSHIGR